MFSPGTPYNSKTHEQLLSAAYETTNTADSEDDGDEEQDAPIETTSTDVIDKDVQQNLRDILNQERENEIEQLAQNTISQEPNDDETAQLITEELNLRRRNTERITTTNEYDRNPEEDAYPSSMISIHSYPPTNQTGIIQDHDRPFAEYGHVDRQAIVEQCRFNLQPTSDQQSRPRYHAKSFAIASSTNVPKEVVMANVQDQFGVERIQYICIGEEISEVTNEPCLYIQLIFKIKIDRRKPFLD